MARPVLIGVELVQVTDPETGVSRTVPDVGAGVREYFTRTGTDTYTATWGEHALTVHRLGRVAGKLWFLGSGSARILEALAHLGADVRLAGDLTTAQRDAILALGVKAVRRVSDSVIVGVLPPVVFAGENRFAVARDGALEDGEEYETA